MMRSFTRSGHGLILTVSLVIALMLGACSEGDGSGGDSVDAFSNNADWEPVVREFDGVEMVQVPAGCFTMGSDIGRRDEMPMSEVCFEEAFWIDRTEVTNAQFDSEGPFPGDNVPRTNITWFDAMEFCERRGARLPTEAEWEYAARGPDNLVYPWGDQLADEYLIYDRNTPGGVADVGSRPEGASWVGAYDMSGNVWEWVSSIYKPYPYQADDGREDRQDDTSRRVYRSGIHSYIDYGVSTSIRFWLRPFKRDWFIGFRCAKSG